MRQPSRARSFLQAHKELENGEIQWNDYVRCLLGHLNDLEDEEDPDKFKSLHWDLLKADPFGYSIFCWSKRNNEIIKGTFRSTHATVGASSQHR